MSGFFDAIDAFLKAVCFKEICDSIIVGVAPFIFILSVLFVIACDDEPPRVSAPTQFFQGEHELFPMDNGGFSTGGTMVFVDGFMGDSASTKTVQFMWKNSNNQFVMSSLPFSKVRLQIDDSNYQSYCKFRWFDNNYTESRWQDNVVYVVFVLKPDQIKFKKTI
jgi:hypothetical protein